MTRRRRSSSWFLRAIGPAIAAGLMGGGCHEPPPLTGELYVSSAGMALIADAATNYDMDPERPPDLLIDHTFPVPPIPEASAPQMWIATLHLKMGHAKPSYRLI